MIKHCALPGCGLPFETDNLNRKYCSASCRNTFQQMMKEQWHDLNRMNKAVEKAMRESERLHEEQKKEEAFQRKAADMKRRSGLLITRSRMEARDEIDL